MPAADIQSIYLGLLGRPADAGGLAYWSEGINSGALTLEDLRANVVNEQLEFINRMEQLSRENFLTQLYNNLFGRELDAEGAEYWVRGEGAAVTLDKLVGALSAGAAEEDADALNNRATVAQQVTDSGLEPDMALLEGVTNDPATVTAAQEAIEQKASGDQEPDEPSSGGGSSIGGGGSPTVTTHTLTEDTDITTLDLSKDIDTIDTAGYTLTGGITAVSSYSITGSGNLTVTGVASNGDLTGINDVADTTLGHISAVTKTDAALAISAANLQDAVSTGNGQVDSILADGTGDITINTVTDGAGEVDALIANLAALDADTGVIKATATTDVVLTQAQLTSLALLDTFAVTGNATITEVSDVEKLIGADMGAAGLTASADLDVTLAGGTGGDLGNVNFSGINQLTLSDTAVTLNDTYTLPAAIDANNVKITLATDANLSGVAVTNYGDLSLMGNVTMSVDQHNGFAGGGNAFGGNAHEMTLSDAGTLTGSATISKFFLAAAGGTSFGVSYFSQSVDASAGTGDTLTFGGIEYAGTIETQAGDTVSVSDGAGLSGVNAETTGVGSAFNANTLEVDDNAAVTMTAAQNNGFTSVRADASETIIISDTANTEGLANIEDYTLASNGELTVTSANTTVSVAGKATTNETVNVAGLTVNGTYALGTGADVLTADTGANISGVNGGSATTAEGLTLTSGASVTMTAAQHGGFSTITADGTETVTLTTKAISSFALNAAVENYVLGDFTNSVQLADVVGGQTVTGGNLSDTITGGTGADIIAGGAAADTLTGGVGTDTIVNTDIANEGNDLLHNFTTATDGAGVAAGADDLQFSDADLTGLAGFADAGSATGDTLLTLNDGTGKVELVVGAGAAANEEVATFAFDTNTGVLTFDADGTGSVGSAITVGTLYSDAGTTAITDLAAGDFAFIA